MAMMGAAKAVAFVTRDKAAQRAHAPLFVVQSVVNAPADPMDAEVTVACAQTKRSASRAPVHSSAKRTVVAQSAAMTAVDKGAERAPPQSTVSRASVRSSAQPLAKEKTAGTTAAVEAAVTVLQAPNAPQAERVSASQAVRGRIVGTMDAVASAGHATLRKPVTGAHVSAWPPVTRRSAGTMDAAEAAVSAPATASVRKAPVNQAVHRRVRIKPAATTAAAEAAVNAPLVKAA